MQTVPVATLLHWGLQGLQVDCTQSRESHAYITFASHNKKDTKTDDHNNASTILQQWRCKCIELYGGCCQCCYMHGQDLTSGETRHEMICGLKLTFRATFAHHPCARPGLWGRTQKSLDHSLCQFHEDCQVATVLHGPQPAQQTRCIKGSLAKYRRHGNLWIA